MTLEEFLDILNALGGESLSYEVAVAREEEWATEFDSVARIAVNDTVQRVVLRVG